VVQGAHRHRPAAARSFASLCGHAIDAPNETLVVEDLALHPGYAQRRRLRGKRPRFYAGVPLLSPKATRSAW
jgi:GAF domain-containing protein